MAIEFERNALYKKCIETNTPFEFTDGVEELVAALAANGVPGFGSSSSTGPTIDREISTVLYRTRVAFVDASLGDAISATRVLDVSGGTATQVGATLWRNESTAADLASAPLAANLELVGASALTDAQLRATAVSVSETKATVSTLTSVASSASSVAIVAANSTRLGVRIFNDSTATMYLAYGATSSLTAFTVEIPSRAYWESPDLDAGLQMSAIWSSANGSARITVVS